MGPTMQVTKAEQVEFALVGGGVTCPTCAVTIETALGSLSGVDDVKVNFAAGRVTVRYDPAQITPNKTQEIIQNTGYKVHLRNQPGLQETEDTEAAERSAERRDITRRLIVAAILTIPVCFCSTVGCSLPSSLR